MRMNGKKMPAKPKPKYVSFDDIGGQIPKLTAAELSALDKKDREQSMRYMPGTQRAKPATAKPKPKIIPIQDRMTGMNTRRRLADEAMGR